MIVGCGKASTSESSVDFDASTLQRSKAIPQVTADAGREVSQNPPYSETYFKPINALAGENFGAAIALSGDGSTLAVGVPYGRSSASVNASFQSGSVSIFRRARGSPWVQVGQIAPANAKTGFLFGGSVSLSTDGNVLAVGALGEPSAAVGVNPQSGQNDTSAPNAGAAYTFIYAQGTWVQQSYVKASNAQSGTQFGSGVALSGDGRTMAIGSQRENSSAVGITSTAPLPAASPKSWYGAVYVYDFDGNAWHQDFYIKASNASLHSYFGASVSLSADGSSLAVGAPTESTAASG